MTKKVLLSVRDDAVPLEGTMHWERCAREFPTVAARSVLTATQSDQIIDVSAWRSPKFDPFEFDRRVGDAAEGPLPSLLIVGDDGPDLEVVAIEVLTRLQGRIGRRNAASRTPLFDSVLVAHRARHDLSKALVRADFNHALDVWQWMLRLSPEASLPVQLAALFHDVERLVSEAERRVEQYAPNYQAFKDAHARAGAEMTREILTGVGVPEDVFERTCELIQEHERAGNDPERALLNDADALSFFSLNSAGFLSYYGVEHTRRKIDYSLNRMRSPARDRLRQIRYRADVAALLREQLAGGRR